MGGVSGRYARALFSVAEGAGKGEVERYGSILEEVYNAYVGNAGFRELFSGPQYTEGDRSAFLASVLTDGADAPLLGFFRMLVEKGRMNILDHILLDYRRMQLDELGIREALIESAFPLDEKTVGEIREAFRKKVGASEIKATVRVVPELIGGIRVIIDSAVFDGSIRAELARMRKTFGK